MTRGKNEIENNSVLWFMYAPCGFSDLEELTLRDDLCLVFCLSLSSTHTRRGLACAKDIVVAAKRVRHKWNYKHTGELISSVDLLKVPKYLRKLGEKKETQ